jgi:hypothetical protein
MKTKDQSTAIHNIISFERDGAIYTHKYPKKKREIPLEMVFRLEKMIKTTHKLYRHAEKLGWSGKR